jgi:hypothetical protein
MSLSYLRDDCHKQAVTHIWESRRFESMYILQGKTRPTCHVRFPLQSTQARCTLLVGSPRTWQPFAGSHEVETGSYTRKKSWQPKIDYPKQAPTLILPPMRQPWSRRERFRPNGYIATSAYWVHITSMQSVCLILARGGQPIGPQPIHAGATTLEVPACHIPTPRPSQPVVSPFP